LITSFKYIELSVMNTYICNSAIANSKPVIANKNDHANGVTSGRAITANTAKIELKPAQRIASASAIK